MIANNIIQKQIVYLDFDLPVSQPHSALMDASQWCNDILMPVISSKLEKYEGFPDTIRLDKITIELNEQSGRLDGLLADKIALLIESVIETKIKSAAIAQGIVVKNERMVIDAFIFFLQNGYLPWWSDINTTDGFGGAMEVIATNMTDDDKKNLLVLLSNPLVARRYSMTLTSDIFSRMLSSLLKKETKFVNDLLIQVGMLSSLIQSKELQNLFILDAKQELVYAFVKKQESLFAIKKIIKVLTEKYEIETGKVKDYLRQKNILRENEIKMLFDEQSTLPVPQMDEDAPGEMINPATSRDQTIKLERSYSQKGEGVYINNAGLVLLAPFLPHFFENLGIVENKQFNSKDLALALLQWLVTGNDDYAEFDLVLPKVLCGMEVEDTITVISRIPESFKTECTDLLRSVIGHWNILKNTSVEGLRESFLQRNGKVMFTNNEWLLQVEQKSFDMLLQDLPWNSSMIKLPWMTHLLKTEWIN